MDFFSVILNYNKPNDYLIDPNRDPLLTSSIISNLTYDSIPELVDFDSPLDDINYKPIIDIEAPYESLLTQLNPVDLSPNPYIEEPKNTRSEEDEEEKLTDEFDNFDDDDDYPNDQLIIDCLLEDSNDIVENFVGDDETDDNENNPNGPAINDFEMRNYQPDIDRKVFVEILGNGEIGKQAMELSLQVSLENNNNMDSSKYSTDFRAEKENQTPNVHQELNTFQYVNSSPFIMSFPESGDDNNIKQEPNSQVSDMDTSSSSADSNFDSLDGPLSLPAPNSSSVSSTVCCCRKHEKYVKKLANRKHERPVKEKLFVAEYLYTSLDKRPGSWLKPKFSHNILCAFAILCGSDQEMMIEVSGIYKFLCRCFPYFETAELHWKNSLRHSLTTCYWFHKTEVHRTAMKGYKWTINWDNMTCLAWEINKQCIKDVTSLYHCLSRPDVCEDLMKVGLLAMDQTKLALLRQSYKHFEGNNKR